jgi:hypothetical protein
MYRADRDEWEELYHEIVGAIDEAEMTLKNLETDYDELVLAVKALDKLVSDLWSKVEEISADIVLVMNDIHELEDEIETLNYALDQLPEGANDEANRLRSEIKAAERELKTKETEEERLRDEFYEVSQEWVRVKYTELPRAEAERDEIEDNMIEMKINVIPEMEEKRDVAYHNWQFFVEVVDYWEDLQARADQFVLAEIPDLYSLHF